MKAAISMLLLCLSQLGHAVVVLQYHHVSDKTPPATSISPALFTAHLDYLEKAQFDVISIEKLAKLLREGESLPNRTAVITFDDGYRSVYRTAYPELKRRGFTFAVFVNTEPHDEQNPLYMPWAELKALSASGVTIANHTVSHPHLIRQLPSESRAQWLQRRENEITLAQQRIAKKVGRSPKLFAYPYGEYDSDLREYLRREGYIAFGQNSGPIADNSDHQALPRFPFGGVYGAMDDFALKVNSVPFAQGRIKVSTDDGRVLSDPLLPLSVDKPVLRIISPLIPYANGLACYASGQGRISTEVKGGVLVAKAKRPLPPGRSRYNCTAQAGGGAYYWHSQLFIRRKTNGQWGHE